MGAQGFFFCFQLHNNLIFYNPTSSLDSDTIYPAYRWTHLPCSHSLLLISALNVWQILRVYDTAHFVPSREEYTPSYLFLFFCFLPIGRKLQWKQCFLQLWTVNLNQFNNPSKGVFAFRSLSLVVAFGSTHFSITYIFIFQWVLKEVQGRARDRECSWRRPPHGY